MLKILTSKPWRSTHHTLGHVATAAWQVFPRQCFHLVLLPVTDLIHYLTFLLPPLETQQDTTYLSRLCFSLHFSSPSHQKTEQKKSDQWTTSSRLASLFRTNRKSDIRSVNCISLVGHIFMARERRHSLSIQRDNTNCKIRILKRCSRFIAGFFLAKLFRARSSAVRRRRTKTSSPSLSGQGLKWRSHGGGRFGFIDYEYL